MVCNGTTNRPSEKGLLSNVTIKIIVRVLVKPRCPEAQTTGAKTSSAGDKIDSNKLNRSSQLIP